MRIRRRPVTLVEILIVMTILALIGAGVGINVTASLHEQRFRLEVSRFVDSLRLAQDLMLIMNTNVHVRVKASENELTYFLDVDGGIPKSWQKIIGIEPKFLKEIHGVFFNDELPFPSTPGQLDIRFQSGGGMMSRGVLRLSTHDQENHPGAIVMAVCLKGYPQPINSVLEGETPLDCSDPGAEEIQTRLTSYTLREVEEDEQMLKAVRKSMKKDDSSQNASP